MGQSASETLGHLASKVAAGATTAQSTAWVPLKDFSRFQGVVQIGTATGTLDAKLEQATDGTGTGAVDITGHAITQVAAGGAANKVYLIDLDTDDVAETTTHIRLTVTPGGAHDIAASVVGASPRYVGAGADLNGTVVAELVRPHSA